MKKYLISINYKEEIAATDEEQAAFLFWDNTIYEIKATQYLGYLSIYKLKNFKTNNKLMDNNKLFDADFSQTALGRKQRTQTSILQAEVEELNPGFAIAKETYGYLNSLIY
jgi:hypothetical protein